MIQRYRLSSDGLGIEKELSGERGWQFDPTPPKKAVDLLAVFRGSGERGDEDFRRCMTTSVSLQF